MGAWDYGPFDNDGAWDCAEELGDDPAANADLLRSAMAEVLDNTDYIENPEAQGAVAAAVLIAVRLGAEPPAERVGEVAAAHPFTATPDLRVAALRTLDRLRDPEINEWHDLWNEVEALDKVYALLQPYREALEAD